MRNLKLALTLVLVSTSAACSPLDDVLAGIFGRSMRDQPSLDPYEGTLDAPENSVPFAAGNMTAGAFELNIGQPEHGAEIPDFDALATATFAPVLDAMENPVPADQASLERGEEMYLRTCAVCHGETGVGAEAYIIEKHPALVAFNLASAQVAGYSDGYIYGMIRVGRGLMPAYGHQVSHFDRWHIVNYVRSLQQAAGNQPQGDN